VDGGTDEYDVDTRRIVVTVDRTGSGGRCSTRPAG
jgi:hypothetical protein